ncbi:MAG TPA: cupin domain-containing protein [Patescibacteria group bacterium]|nr:cupin domain-containing protein [Patescibacteria group bacterium]
MKENKRFFNLVPELDGQVNVYVYQNTEFKGWHLHQNQEDMIFCVSGKLKIFLHAENDEYVCTRVLEKGESFVIETDVWHGIQAESIGTTVIYFYEKKFDVKDTTELPKDHFKKYEHLEY